MQTREELDLIVLQVHTLPEDLKIAQLDKKNGLYNTAMMYQKLIDSDFLWRVYLVDPYGSYWVEVNFINAKGKAEFHTIRLDEGTYTVFNT